MGSLHSSLERDASEIRPVAPNSTPNFDPIWYKLTNPDLHDYEISLSHYLTKGWRELRSPNPLFSPSHYFSARPDVLRANIEPLTHFVTAGWKDGTNPHPLFELPYYLAQTGTLEPLDPLTHFFSVGMRHGFFPGPHLKPALAYAQRSGRTDMAAVLRELLAPESPLARVAMENCIVQPLPPRVDVAAMRAEMIETIRASALFDEQFYRQTYADVGECDPIAHYVDHGAALGRQPHALFDTAWYISRCPDAVSANPLVHYVTVGAKQDLNPNPLFDSAWYRQQYRDADNSRMPPLSHYVSIGFKLDYNPNPWFDARWYRDTYGDIVPSNLDPLTHYLRVGERNGLNPSERFETEWYRTVNPDVRRAGASPLTHFLHFGQHEDRDPSSRFIDTKPVEDCELRCLKKPLGSSQAVLFVSHSADGTIKPHVKYFIEALSEQGFAVVLILACDGELTDPDEQFVEQLAGLYVRANEGFDFAAWAHVARLNPWIYESDLLIFTNDSILGPLDRDAFAKMIERIRDSDCDAIGLTENYELKCHLQSYFIALKNRALRLTGFRDFLDGVVVHPKKSRIIVAYETELTAVLQKSGAKTGALWPTPDFLEQNPSIFGWRQLIDRGMPFLKVSVLREQDPLLDNGDWQNVLAEHGYPLSMANAAISHRDLADVNALSSAAYGERPADIAAVTSLAPHHQDAEPSFSADFYRAIYPDVAAAGVDLRDHFDRYGKFEGRIGAVGGLSRLVASAKRLMGRETILIVSHEGLRGGAPILVYNLMKAYQPRFNVVVAFIHTGEIADAVDAEGGYAVGPLTTSERAAEFAIRAILEATPVKFAIVNSIASRSVLPALAQNGIASVSLIHEFPAYIRPRSAFIDMVRWSNEVIFSSSVTADSAKNEFAELREKTFSIVPQGRSLLPPPVALAGSAAPRDESMRARHTLRPADLPAEAVVVLGIGTVEYRKGLDLFVDLAARCLRVDERPALRFVWIGRGYNPDSDSSYSAFIADEIERFGIAGQVQIIDEVTDLEPYYQLADVLALTSRLDPLPNVGIDALHYGLPLLCFEKTTGLASILRDNGLGRLVAGYLDTHEMAAKLAALARAPDERGAIATTGREVAGRVFDMARYAETLTVQAAHHASSPQRELKEARAIVRTKIIAEEYYAGTDKPSQSSMQMVLEAVRSWSTATPARKLLPGFHPGVFAESTGFDPALADPTLAWLKRGKPAGPWTTKIIGVRKRIKPPRPGRVALHIHSYYNDLLPDIVDRLLVNAVRPDLYISVTDDSSAIKAEAILSSYRAGAVKIEVVPNIGRDIGSFLTTFAEPLQSYDFIGHIHTKKSADVRDREAVNRWNQFLLENLIGGNHPMADVILTEMDSTAKLGIVFPDDPHVIGWTRNRPFAESLWQRLYPNAQLPQAFWFPVGTMFWARPKAIAPLFEARFEWADYPAEPLPYDGTMLHALERLFALVAQREGFELATTVVPEYYR